MSWLANVIIIGLTVTVIVVFFTYIPERISDALHAWRWRREARRRARK
jgi:hypothetical protein